jgi:hypothetical protein
MNWKRVYDLICVDRKSGRLIRGQRLIHYRESRTLTYLLYGGAIVIGLAVGIGVGFLYDSNLLANPSLKSSYEETVQGVFLALPTIILVFSFIFTLLMQIQRSGLGMTTQVPYWLPVTWQEHTLASVVASLLGFPAATIAGLSVGVLLFGGIIDQTPFALGVVVAVWAAAFLASATTEVLRVVQVRFIGAVYKSTGRAAVWVRFAGSLIFFIVVYFVYFYLTQGTAVLGFVKTVASTQSAIWFVPYVWLGITLYCFATGLLLRGLTFLLLSALLVLGLFYLATLLNKRFGLYEPPALTISKGVYAPKAGFLGRLGFSSSEEALIRKDFKAFTRRRELITVFIIPIIILILPITQSLGSTSGSDTITTRLMLPTEIFLLPASLMSMSLGTFIMGEEGQAVWRIFSSPISPRNLVKSKYFFIVIFSLLILIVTSVIGFLVFKPSTSFASALLLIAVFLSLALGAVSLSNGIRGADFVDAPRARMIRQEWSLINSAACLLAALAVLAPFFPFFISSLMRSSAGILSNLYVGVAASAIVSIVVTVIFLKISVKNARTLLSKAET